MMEMCRTCLKSPANKHILDLERAIKDDNKDSFHIMLFCLDIQVVEDSKITTNLCNSCYRKIISYYRFKDQSLKNDAYLKSLKPAVQSGEQILSLYVDENGIKRENFIDTDVFGPCHIEDNTELKTEDLLENIKNEDSSYGAESDEEPLNIVQKIKYENVKIDNKKTAPEHRKRGCSKKKKLQKTRQAKEKSKVCEECGKSVRDLKEHLLLHQAQGERRLFQCESCPKLFKTASGRRRHRHNINLGLHDVRKKKSVCDICNKEFRSLKSHIMIKHNKESLPHGCVSCERRYLSRAALAIHMASTHLDKSELPYECDICKKKYCSKLSVSNHIRQRHLNEKNYQCDICSKTFFEKRPFIGHMETHSKVPLYKCTDCGLALKTMDTLRSHRLLHTSDKRIPCKLCSKTFQKIAYLRTHMETHTAVKRFACRCCGTRFRRADHRGRHERTAHQKIIKDE